MIYIYLIITKLVVWENNRKLKMYGGVIKASILIEFKSKHNTLLFECWL